MGQASGLPHFFLPARYHFFVTPRFLWAIPVLLQAQSYVDSKLCADCHPKIAATYARTGMARAFQRLNPQTFESPAPYLHRLSNTWYAMLRRDDAIYQRRWRIAPDGREVQVRELRVDYVMGSGNHARSYLHRTPRGTLLELDLACYPENGGIWGMAPGHDRDYILPPRTIAYECMGCHNAYPRIPAGHDEPGAEPVYEANLPEGIDCQRCHGPGGNHVRAAQTAAAPVDAIRAAIVNPARLPAQRQMEVCLQCHLETTSLQLPHSIQRYGRAPFSYRPGQPLADLMLFFDHAAGSKYQDDFEIAHSAYRLRKSQCFLRSADRLTCTTCHNPHDIPRGEEAVAHYDRACLQCHAAASHASRPNCTGCHMPKRRTQDVVHAVMTDHLIQRRAPSTDPLAPLAERQEFDANQYHGDVVPYYPTPLPQTPENALYLAVAQVTQRSNLGKGLPRLAAEIAKQNPPRPEFYVELGQAWIAAGKPVNAITAFEAALKRKPDSAVTSLALGDALTEAGQPTRAIAVLTSALKTAPKDPLLWYQLAIAHSGAGSDEQAIAALEKSIAADSDLAEPHNLLGELLAGQGDLARAEQMILHALEIHPDLPEALGNLAHLRAAAGNLPEAVFYFARAIHLKPNEAEVRTNYAATLLGLKQLDEALEQAEAAVKLRPASGLAHLIAAQALIAKGDQAAARTHLSKAAQDPDPDTRRRAAQLLGR
jgi:tetratricopeptide (TPR) repeat protein